MSTENVIVEHPIGLQELAIRLNLTNLQIVGLNGIGDDIKRGKEGYLSVADSLSPQEDAYLRAWLRIECGMDMKESA